MNTCREFNNTYEQTKSEAEVLVHSYIEKGLPVIIARPSIISGNSETGEITKSNLIYEIIKQLKDGIFKDFICNEDSSINIIPIDYFIDALLHISKSDDNIGKTFNMTNKTNMNVMQMLNTACRELGIEPLTIFSTADKKSSTKLTRLALSKFLCYIELSHTFDDSQTQKALQGTGISCPVLDDEFTVKILDYCKGIG
jgi:nucleoside-diphosphate-sugar epimerase